ncbi:MAG: hypothetical protein AAB458_02550 [Patescibacteria group bacterium]
MDEQDFNKVIQNRLAELPESVRSAIAHINYPQQVQNLMQRFQLRLDQAGIVDREIMLVLLGMEHPDILLNNLVREGGIARDVATQIVNDLNENIFKAIKQDLVETYTKDQLVEEILDPNKSRTVLPDRSATQSTPSQSPQVTLAQPTPTQPTGIDRTMPNDIAKTKLEQSFRIPPQTTTVPLHGDIPKMTPPARRTLDPYREPTQ